MKGFRLTVDDFVINTILACIAAGFGPLITRAVTGQWFVSALWICYFFACGWIGALLSDLRRYYRKPRCNHFRVKPPGGQCELKFQHEGPHQYPASGLE